MAIQALEGLERLRPKVDAEIHAALSERESLGLGVPAEFDVILGLYGDGGTEEAATENGKQFIWVNAIPLAAEHCSGSLQKTADFLSDYFTIMRRVVDFEEESHLVRSLQDHRSMRTLLSSASFSPSLQDHLAFAAYEEEMHPERKALLLNQAPLVRKKLGRLPTELAQAKNIRLSLRHELDHLQFYRSPWYVGHEANEEAAITRAADAFARERTPETLRAYADAKSQYLIALSTLDAALEARGLFFNHVPFGKWKTTDMSGVATRVCDWFRDVYVDGFYAATIVDTLAAQALSTGELGEKEARYLFARLVDDREGTRPITDCGVPSGYKVTERILHTDLPAWRQVFLENGKAAADAIGQAYTQNPATLKETDRATSFTHFIELCSKA